MRKKILIVDDEPDIADALRTILADRGFQVRVCSNGIDAVTALFDETPDLMIMDVMLPGMDGHSLITKLRDEGGEALCAMPIIVISALEPSGSMFNKFPQVTAFITKPFELSNILDAVRRALEKKEKPHGEA